MTSRTRAAPLHRACRATRRSRDTRSGARPRRRWRSPLARSRLARSAAHRPGRCRAHRSDGRRRRAAFGTGRARCLASGMGSRPGPITEITFPVLSSIPPTGRYADSVTSAHAAISRTCTTKESIAARSAEETARCAVSAPGGDSRQTAVATRATRALMSRRIRHCGPSDPTRGTTRTMRLGVLRVRRCVEAGIAAGGAARQSNRIAPGRGR
jgi:hypothetical protein